MGIIFVIFVFSFLSMGESVINPSFACCALVSAKLATNISATQPFSYGNRWRIACSFSPVLLG